jgi:myo-inositol-1(or 4)-monophosphatase
MYTRIVTRKGAVLTMEEEIKGIARKAVKAGGAILMGYFGKIKSIGYKGDINIVTEADQESERKIISIIIKDTYPTHRIVAEETGDSGLSSPYKWIIDPLDGTTNYAHGYPCFCVSIAIEYEKDIIFGIIYDPVREELFTAEQGKGSHLNGTPISVSSEEGLNTSLLCTGFPYDVREDMDSNIHHFRNFLMNAQAVRRDGSAALDLCYTAAGRFDGFWEQKLHPWDVAAGSLIVSEAGGKVTTYSGETFNIYGTEIVASNGIIHNQMLDVLGRADQSS